MTVSDDACALIVQAVACTLAEILCEEESAETEESSETEESAETYRDTAVGQVRRSVHDVYRCLGNSYFRCAYHMSYRSLSAGYRRYQPMAPWLPIGPGQSHAVRFAFSKDGSLVWDAKEKPHQKIGRKMWPSPLVGAVRL